MSWTLLTTILQTT